MKHPLRIKKYGRGRPAEEGARYPSGKLRPPGPTDEALAKRSAKLQDATWGATPIEAAFVAGWLSPLEFAAARIYLGLRRRAYDSSVGPRLAQASRPEVDITYIDVSGDKIMNWSRAQIAEVFDRVFGGDAPDPEAKERANAKASERLKAIHAAMGEGERNEVIQVCVWDSWPQWLVQRKAAEAIRERAAAENRGCTDAEQAKIYRRFHSSFERKRDLLISGLRIVIKHLNPDANVEAVTPYDAEIIEPTPYVPPDDGRGFERTDYVDGAGNRLFVVERKR